MIVKKILNWILGIEDANIQPDDSPRKSEISKCIDDQRRILQYLQKLPEEQRVAFCSGMDYAVSMDKMLRLMTNDELKEYTKAMSRIAHA